MAKLENSLKNMVLSLTAITVIVGGLLGFIASITADPIAQAAAAKQQAAITAVVPGEGTTVGEQVKKTAANGTEAIIFPVSKDGKLIGNAVQAISKNGFGGNITVMVGFDVEGNILGYSVLDCSNETPGLGAKMPDWFQEGQKGNVIGMNPAKNNVTVSKDGGEVDAITAATISSRAFCDAVAQAYGVLSGADVTTSASQQAIQQPTDSLSCCQSDSCQCEMVDGQCAKEAAGECCKQNK